MFRMESHKDHLDLETTKWKLNLLALLVLLSPVANLGAQDPSPKPAATTITQQNLSEHINDLRSRPPASYIISGPVRLDSAAGRQEVWYVEDLAFADGSTIFIGEKQLTLNVRGRLLVPPGNPLIIASFPSAERTAAAGAKGSDGNPGQHGSGDGAGGATGGSGQAGFPGTDGLAGGALNLVISRSPDAPFSVSLVGQNGGNGGTGGNGGRGGNGQTGRTAKSGAFGCERGGGDGGNGGNGGRGGNGGTGGRCGAGGQMMVFGPPDAVDAARELVTFSRESAEPGTPGGPGSGGPGGSGGGMGRGSGYCGGGRGGSSGAAGAGGGKPSEEKYECLTPQLQFHPIDFSQ